MSKPRSVFRLWATSAEVLLICQQALAEELRLNRKNIPRILELTPLALSVSEACDRKLSAELRAHRETIELRKLDLDGMDDKQLKKLFDAYAKKRGLRHVSKMRDRAVETLVSAGQPIESAQLLIDRILPAVPEPHEQRTMNHTLRKDYDSLEDRLDEGRAMLEEAHDDLQEAMGSAEVIDVPSEDHPTTVAEGPPESIAEVPGAGPPEVPTT